MPLSAHPLSFNGVNAFPGSALFCRPRFGPSDLPEAKILRAICERLPKTRCPMIMCSAKGDAVPVVTAINEGANDYMLARQPSDSASAHIDSS